jgi:hypothetical protein
VYQVTIIDGYATYREFLFNIAEIPTTEIWYTSLDGNVVEPYSKTVFGATYDSSTYGKSKGIMTFAGEVTKIGANAFNGKTTLTSVTPPSSVKEIGNNAFRGCTALTKAVIPDGVATLGEYAFYQCSALKSIVISDSVTKLGAYSCFSNCSSLESVKLSKNITTIPYTCFYNCTSLTSIEIPYGVTEIGTQAFRICNSLRSIVIPDSVTIINNEAFRQMSNLETVVLPANLESLGKDAFQNCTSLKSINIPSNLKRIEGTTFQNCIFETINIPNSINYIGSYAFSMTTIKRVDINSLSSWCNIEFADFRANPAWYNADMYVDGEVLTNLITPSDITKIKAYAFYGQSASLKSVTITDNVTSIGNQAFYNRKGLTSVTFESTTPPDLGTDVFTNTHASLQLRVPSSAVEAYKAAYADLASKIVGY